MVRDPSKQVSDFTYLGTTNNKRKRIDFALISLQQMRSGVDVLAATDGCAQELRNGMGDQILSSEKSANIKGKECGN